VEREKMKIICWDFLCIDVVRLFSKGDFFWMFPKQWEKREKKNRVERINFEKNFHYKLAH
jgi:hypothetical protein